MLGMYAHELARIVHRLGGSHGLMVTAAMTGKDKYMRCSAPWQAEHGSVTSSARTAGWQACTAHLVGNATLYPLAEAEQPLMRPNEGGGAVPRLALDICVHGRCHSGLRGLALHIDVPPRQCQLGDLACTPPLPPQECILPSPCSVPVMPRQRCSMGVFSRQPWLGPGVMPACTCSHEPPLLVQHARSSVFEDPAATLGPHLHSRLPTSAAPSWPAIMLQAVSIVC